MSTCKNETKDMKNNTESNVQRVKQLKKGLIRLIRSDFKEEFKGITTQKTSSHHIWTTVLSLFTCLNKSSLHGLQTFQNAAARLFNWIQQVVTPRCTDFLLISEFISKCWCSLLAESYTARLRSTSQLIFCTFTPQAEPLSPLLRVF